MNSFRLLFDRRGPRRACWLAALCSLAIALEVRAAAPSISNILDRFINEDETATIGFSVSDADSGPNPLTISATSDNPTLVPNANLVPGGTGGARTLQVTPLKDQNGTATITVVVSDGDLSSSDTFKLTVNPRNDPPSIVPVPDLVMDEDKLSVPVNITIGDVDTDLSRLQVSADTPSGSIIDPANIRFTGDGATRTMVLLGSTNRFGSTIVTIFVRDAEGGQVSDQFAVTINPVNDPPTVSSILDQVVQEDRLLLVGFTVRDLETPNGDLATTAVADDKALLPDESIVVSAISNQRGLNIRPAPDRNGSTRITVTVRDADGASVQTSFLLTVTPVPDPPTISAIPDQIVPENTTIGPLNFRIFDPDTPADTLLLTREVDLPGVVPTANIVLGGQGTNRTVLVAPLPNVSGSARITLKISDGQAQVQTVFRVTFTAVNGVPRISAIPNQSGPPGQPIGPIPFRIDDDETRAANLQLSRSSSNPAVLPDANITFGGSETNRTVTVRPVGEGTATVTITVSDGSAPASTSFQVSSSSSTAQEDFGDASSVFPVLLPTGARHTLRPNFSLGPEIDAEADGNPTTTATGDDSSPTAGPDDEDGILLPANFLPGQAATLRALVNIPPGNTAFLNAWIDLGLNNSWAEAGDRVISNRFVTPGTNTLTINLPSSAQAGLAFARFRLSSAPLTGPGGAAADGEVEDYLVQLGSGVQPGNADFSDAPEDQSHFYPTTLANGGAYHNNPSKVFLGQLHDEEADGQPSIGADADDFNPANSDDEDGVTLPSVLIPGSNTNIAVFVTSILEFNWLHGWVDFNGDGDWNDPSEHVYAAESVNAGLNILTLPIPAAAQSGATYARFRITGSNFPNPVAIPPGGGQDDGEVEDYRVDIDPEGGSSGKRLDYGDAPNSNLATYPVLLVDNGARHANPQRVYLGQVVDLEFDGQPSPFALEDDRDPVNSPDDEDGVRFVGALVAGQTATVEVTVFLNGFQNAWLHGWIDFDRDGTWTQANEHVFQARAVTPGLNVINFQVPAAANSGLTFARFRVTGSNNPPGAIIPFTGEVQDGEVEDYILGLQRPPQDDPCEGNNQGSDFWLAYPGNYAPNPSNVPDPRVWISGPSGTTGTVEMPGLGVVRNFTIPASLVIGVPVPPEADLGNLNDAIAAKAVRVLSSAPVTVHAINQVDFTSDGYLALPQGELGTFYVVQAYGNVHTAIPELNGTQFAILTAASNTVVTITPTVTISNRLAFVPYDIVLNPGEVYQLRGTADAPEDLSGTVVSATSPIAVFGSHRCANVQSQDAVFCDYLVEQLLPSNRAGQEFLTTPLSTRLGDTFRFFAIEDGTDVTVGSEAPVSLNRGEFLETVLTTATTVIASRPVHAQQYANSSDYDDVAQADPFMVTLPHTGLFLDAYTFSTAGSAFSNHWINVTIAKSASASLLLDNNPVTNSFGNIPGSDFTYVRIPVTQGAHSISADEPFGLIVYGWNTYESYGWLGGISLGDTTPPVLTCPTSNVVVAPSIDGPSRCLGLVPDLRQQVRVTDDCGLSIDTIVEQDPAPGAALFPGEYTITFSARDASGNLGTCSTPLEVSAVEAPFAIRCPADRTVPCVNGESARVFFVVTAGADCRADVPVVSQPPSGSIFPLGTTRVICTAIDPETRQPVTCSFNVTVRCFDLDPPTITLEKPDLDGFLRIDVLGEGVLETVSDLGGLWRGIPLQDAPELTADLSAQQVDPRRRRFHRFKPDGSKAFFRVRLQPD